MCFFSVVFTFCVLFGFGTIKIMVNSTERHNSFTRLLFARLCHILLESILLFYKKNNAEVIKLKTYFRNKCLIFTFYLAE